MAEFASRGVANTGLGLGIAGTALGILNGNGNGILSGLFGNNTAGAVYSEDRLVNRYDLQMNTALMEKDGEIAILKSENFTNSKILELANSVQGKFNQIDAELRDIAVYQATNTAGIGCLTNQVNNLQAAFNGLTKTVIPSANVCNQGYPVLVTNTQTDPVYVQQASI